MAFIEAGTKASVQLINALLKQLGYGLTDTQAELEVRLKKVNGVFRLTIIENEEEKNIGEPALSLDGLSKSQFLRSDADDTFSGTLTSTKTSGVAMKFDNGSGMITVHDGTGNLNIKSGVDESHEIIGAAGGTHVELSETGGITLAISTQAAGQTFTDDVYLDISSSGITSNAKIASNILSNHSLANGSSYDTGIPNNSAGILILKNVTDNYSAIFLLTSDGAGTARIASGSNGVGFFYPLDMSLRICVIGTGGTYIIKNRVGVTKSISYGFFALD